jgi:hypothetical protein
MTSTTCAKHLNNILPTIPFNHYGFIESKLLHLVSSFLEDRYEKVENISKYLSDDIQAYNCNNKTSVIDYIVKNVFDVFPISNIQAIGRKNCARVSYTEGFKIISENFYCNNNYEICYIETYYDSIPNPHMIININEAVKSVKILKLTMEFLEADIHMNYDKQYQLLSDDAYCFSAKGKENVSLMQRENTLTTGNSYSVPYPVIVDNSNNCVSLDFNAYPSGQDIINRGTDIMYVDLEIMKIIRIDTLRHTLRQPEWVIKHFTQE